MMGERQVAQEALFYEFSLERHVPAGHWVRAIDSFVDLSEIRAHLRPFYSETGRPSIDPELMIRMLLIGYCFGIRSERRLCDEVHLNLAYRWFCRLGLEGAVPDHSTFSKNRHGRFRESNLLRELFETTVRRCIAEGLVGGESFAVDAGLIKADANKQRSAEASEPVDWDDLARTRRSVREYLDTLDEAAWGAASEAKPQERFGLWPAKLVADSAYGSAENLAWLVHERGIEPHIPVFDKSQRSDGTFSRSDFAYDHDRDLYTCPGGKELRQRQKVYRTERPLVDENGLMRYHASKFACDACSLKPQCCPNTSARKILRSIHEGARDMARDIAATDAYSVSRRERKKVEMLFAHLKRILRLDRLRLRGPNGARDEFHLAAAAQNLRKLAKLLPNGPQIRPV